MRELFIEFFQEHGLQWLTFSFLFGFVFFGYSFINWKLEKIKSILCLAGGIVCAFCFALPFLL